MHHLRLLSGDDLRAIVTPPQFSRADDGQRFKAAPGTMLLTCAAQLGPIICVG